MIKDAEKFADEDKKNVERIEARNAYEQNMYRVKTALDGSTSPELKQKLDDLDETDQGLVEELTAYLKECETWLDENPSAEKEEFEHRSKELDDKFAPLSDKLSVKGEAGGPGGMPGMGGGGMPNLSPEQMAQFQEMMQDPEKKAQMEAMAAQMGGGMPGMQMPSGMGSDDDIATDTPKGPSIEEVD